jgi:hypothetical protein
MGAMGCDRALTKENTREVIEKRVNKMPIFIIVIFCVYHSIDCELLAEIWLGHVQW